MYETNILPKKLDIEKECEIQDIHMKEQGLEEILKQIYRGEIVTC